MYQTDILNVIRDKDYHPDVNPNKVNRNKYEYSHDNNVKEVAIQAKKRDESQIREKL